jgi:NTP pyrophosphatase (non-canonical NTP hydrolase)
MTEHNNETWQAAANLAHEVTTENYGQYARKTEPAVTVAQELPAEVTVLLQDFLAAVHQIARVGDQLKRLIFYGKGDPLQIRTHLEDCGVLLGDVAKSTAVTLSPEQYRLLHGFLGMFTEAGELLEAWENHTMRDQPLDRVNMGEELGDSGWYWSLVLDVLQLLPRQVDRANIAKLAYRYPAKFNGHAAVNRDLTGERKLLELFLQSPAAPAWSSMLAEDVASYGGDGSHYSLQ